MLGPVKFEFHRSSLDPCLMMPDDYILILWRNEMDNMYLVVFVLSIVKENGVIDTQPTRNFPILNKKQNEIWYSGVNFIP